MAKQTIEAQVTVEYLNNDEDCPLTMVIEIDELEITDMDILSAISIGKPLKITLETIEHQLTPLEEDFPCLNSMCMRRVKTKDKYCTEGCAMAHISDLRGT